MGDRESGVRNPLVGVVSWSTRSWTNVRPPDLELSPLFGSSRFVKLAVELQGA